MLTYYVWTTSYTTKIVEGIGAVTVTFDGGTNACAIGM